MIPINKRLSIQEQKEYVKQVIGLRKKWRKDEIAVSTFLKVIKKSFILPSSFVNFDDLEEYKSYPNLSKWLLLSFDQIMLIRDTIEKDECKCVSERDGYYDEYLKFLDTAKHFRDIYKSFSTNNINNWIIKTTGVRVCPYCNMAYTFNREKTVTGQLDHFLPESKYPEFAICYYNLIPSCPTCNRIKKAESGTLVSPYEDNAYSSMRIIATAKKRINYMNLKEIEENIDIKVTSERKEEKENIRVFELNETYSQVKDYAAEILKKRSIYKNKYARELIINAVKRAGITDDEILRFYLGNYKNRDKGRRILDKMVSDLFD